MVLLCSACMCIRGFLFFFFFFQAEDGIRDVAVTGVQTCALPIYRHHLPLGCKLLSTGKMMTVPVEEAPANSVPAAAVIQRVRALFGIIGRKGRVGGVASHL